MATVTYKRSAAPAQRIMRLTAAQEQRLVEWREEWLRVGLDTRPADRPRAEAAIRAMCARIGVECPPIVWCNGPLTMALTYAAMKSLIKRASLHDSLDASLHASLHASLGASLGETINEIVWWWRWWYSGQHSLAWWAHYAYCRDELDVQYGRDQSADLDLWLEVSRSCGWWRPRDGIIWVCERPLIQTLDENSRLHNDDGPAILCRDGFGVWAVHGVRVPQRVITGEFNAQDILAEENAEVRRVMVDRYGPGRYLSEVDAKLVDDDPEWGRLWRLDQDDDEPLVMVEVLNSTPEPDGSSRTYWLRVPPDSVSVRGALAWTFDVPEGDYAQLKAQS